MIEEMLFYLSDIDYNTAVFEIEVYKKTGLLRWGIVLDLLKEYKHLSLETMVQVFSAT